MKTSVKYLVQMAACLSIQRVWRGHWSRVKNARVPIKPPPMKRRVLRRHGTLTLPLSENYIIVTFIFIYVCVGMDVLRRMWARSNYEPHGGWPGKLDYLHYDMWEHVDKPPKGRDFGMKTYKVIVVPRSEREKHILVNDQNSWVGLPISFCPFSEYAEEKANEQRKTMSLLAFNTQTNTPYSEPVIYFKPLKSSKPLELMAEINKQSFEYAKDAERELQRAIRAQKETETDTEMRLRLKASKQKKSAGDDEVNEFDLTAVRSRKLRLDADKYFVALGETEELDDRLLATGSAMEQWNLTHKHTSHASTHGSTHNTSTHMPTNTQSNNSIANIQKGLNQDSESNEFIVTKGIVRRGARKPLTRSQRNALREHAAPAEHVFTNKHMRAQQTQNGRVIDPELGIDITTKYDICRQHLSSEEPRLLRLQAIARHNNYSALRSSYAKIRNQFVHNYQAPNLPKEAIEVLKGTNRDKRGMVNNNTWTSTSWGQLKQTVATKYADSHAPKDPKNDNTIDPAQFAHNMIGTGILESDIDSYVNVWSRSVYKPPRPAQSRARVWAVKPKRNYKLRYTWLPQPMMQPAVSKLFGHTELAPRESDEQSDAEDGGQQSPVKKLVKKFGASKTWYPVDHEEDQEDEDDVGYESLETSEDEVDQAQQDEKEADGMENNRKGGVFVSGLTGEYSSTVVDSNNKNMQESSSTLAVPKESPEERRMRILSISGLIDIDTINNMQSNEEVYSIGDSLSLLHVQSLESVEDIEGTYVGTEMPVDTELSVNSEHASLRSQPKRSAQGSPSASVAATSGAGSKKKLALSSISKDSVDFELRIPLNIAPKPPKSPPPQALLASRQTSSKQSSVSVRSEAPSASKESIVSKKKVAPPSTSPPKQAVQAVQAVQTPSRPSQSPSMSPPKSPPQSPARSPSPSGRHVQSTGRYSSVSALTNARSLSPAGRQAGQTSFISMADTQLSAFSSKGSNSGNVYYEPIDINVLDPPEERSPQLPQAKTPTFKQYVQSTKLKPYHKIERESQVADQPYEWH
jgi:hypothetical protein